MEKAALLCLVHRISVHTALTYTLCFCATMTLKQTSSHCNHSCKSVHVNFCRSDLMMTFKWQRAPKTTWTWKLWARPPTLSHCSPLCTSACGENSGLVGSSQRVHSPSLCYVAYRDTESISDSDSKHPHSVWHCGNFLKQLWAWSVFLPSWVDLW